LVYTAPTEAAALDRLVEFTDAWGGQYPAIIKLWENAWAEFIPFLAFDAEIRSVIYTTSYLGWVRGFVVEGWVGAAPGAWRRARFRIRRAGDDAGDRWSRGSAGGGTAASDRAERAGLAVQRLWNGIPRVVIVP
jgi:hypothetical protein